MLGARATTGQNPNALPITSKNSSTHLELMLTTDVRQGSFFTVEETSIARIHEAVLGHRVTARQIVELYLARIEAYDKHGPRINSRSARPESVVRFEKR